MTLSPARGTILNFLYRLTLIYWFPYLCNASYASTKKTVIFRDAVCDPAGYKSPAILRWTISDSFPA